MLHWLFDPDLKEITFKINNYINFSDFEYVCKNIEGNNFKNVIIFMHVADAPLSCTIKLVIFIYLFYKIPI